MRKGLCNPQTAIPAPDLSGEWTVFLHAEAEKPLAAIPEALPGYFGLVTGRKMSLRDGTIDFTEEVGGVFNGLCATLCKEFESPVAGTARLGVSADWWMELQVNGRLVFSSMAEGNGSGAFTPDDHVVEIPVKEGVNVVVAKVVSGAGGWRFVCGAPGFRKTERPKALKLEVEDLKSDALHKCGEPAKFRIKLHELATGKPVAGAKISCSLLGDGGFAKKFEGESSKDGDLFAEATLRSPGAIRCTARVEAEGLETCGTALFEPLSIKPVRPKPDDFDEYWRKAFKELAATPLKPSLKAVDTKVEGVELFSASISCPVSAATAYFARPSGAKPGSLPAFINLPYGGVYSPKKPTALAKAGFLAMDLNAHGLEPGMPDEKYVELEKNVIKDYLRQPAELLEPVLRSICQKAVRAVEFLKAQPEWDGRHLIVSGMSQGGFLALFLSAFDPQVSLCLANVPGFCDATSVLGGTQNWPGLPLRDGKPLCDADVKRLSYFYVSNFAERVKIPCVVSVGLMDCICPASAIYAAFNKIPEGKKRILNGLRVGHGVSGRAALLDFGAEMRKHLAEGA